MGWPKGVPRKPRFKRVAPPDYAPGPDVAEPQTEVESPPEAPRVPADWMLGALLNVRNTGPEYVVTIFPEEFDYQHPERALRFTNTAQCQQFVSEWYARVYSDPRALSWQI